MRSSIISLALVLSCTAASASADAPKQRAEKPVMKSPEQMKWTALPGRASMQVSVLSGDPARGAFTQMRRVPAGADNPPHSHSNELKNIIVSGVWYTGADLATAQDFGPGSIVLMPAGWSHVSGCRKGADCLFYQEGDGKFDFKPVATPAN